MITISSLVLNIVIWFGRHAFLALDRAFDLVEEHTGWHKGDQYFNLAAIIIGLFLFQGVVTALFNFVMLVYRVIVKIAQIPSALRALWMYVVLNRYRSHAKVVPTIVIKTLVNDVDVQESFFDAEAYMLESDVVKGIVFVYVRRDGSDGLARVGMGFVVDQLFYTAAHNIVDSVEIAVSLPFRDEVYTVDLQTTVGDDIAVLSKKGLAATLGLKSLKFALVKDSAPVRILSHDGENHRLLTHSCNTQFVAGRASFIYTKSNTRSGDSGMPILQQGKVVAIHLGANKARGMNIHEIPVHALGSEIRASLKRRSKLVFASDGDGYIAESDLVKTERNERVIELAKRFQDSKYDEMFGRVYKLDPNYSPILTGPSWADMEEDVEQESQNPDPKVTGTPVKVPHQKSPSGTGNQESLKKYQQSLASVDLKSLEAGRSLVRKPKSIQGLKNSSPIANSKALGQ